MELRDPIDPLGTGYDAIQSAACLRKSAISAVSAVSAGVSSTGSGVSAATATIYVPTTSNATASATVA